MYLEKQPRKHQSTI